VNQKFFLLTLQQCSETSAHKIQAPGKGKAHPRKGHEGP
jgi:hypothetical protein